MVLLPTMPEDPVAQVTALFGGLADAWEGRDYDAVLESYHPDAELVLIGGFDALVGPTFKGHDGLRQFFSEFEVAFSEAQLEFEEAIPVDDTRVLLIQRQRTRGRAGGVETVLRWGNVLTFEDGLIIRSENYYDVEEAKRAVGLAD